MINRSRGVAGRRTRATLPSLAMRTTATRLSSPSEPSSYRAAAGRVIAGLWIAAIIYVVALSKLVAGNGGTQATIGAPLVQQVSLLLIWAIATPGEDAETTLFEEES